jgi:hypothetical protein
VHKTKKIKKKIKNKISDDQALKIVRRLSEIPLASDSCFTQLCYGRTQSQELWSLVEASSAWRLGIVLLVDGMLGMHTKTQLEDMCAWVEKFFDHPGFSAQSLPPSGTPSQEQSCKSLC